MNIKLFVRIFVSLLVISIPITVIGSGFSGEFKIGHVLLDEVGSQSVNQPTYNLYKGPIFSIENLRYTFANGARLTGNLSNLTLNNRNLRVALSQRGSYGLSISNNQYRRTYSDEGGKFTRRRQTSSNIWVQPTNYLKVFGGYGIIAKRGSSLSLPGTNGLTALNSVDYEQQEINVGVRLNKDNRLLKVEFRTSDFSDDLYNGRDRKTKRLRISGAGALPQYENILVNAGFQKYSGRLTETSDTLLANTFWGGIKWYLKKGTAIRYSTMIDRARRTGDLSASDNISHTVYLDQVWAGIGGITGGYSYRVNDDLYDQVTSNGYLLSGWLIPFSGVTMKGSYGSENEDIKEGRTLTGAGDLTKYRASIRYKHPSYGITRISVENRVREFDDIGSKVEYTRASANLSSSYIKHANIQLSYSYSEGIHENSSGSFKFDSHIISGDLLISDIGLFTFGSGGSYVRSSQDVDVESSSIRFNGAYRFMKDHRFEVVYTAHNYDNIAAMTAPYTEYYTANVVELSVVKEF